MKKNRHHFLLLEVLLSIFFATIILTILFQYFTQVVIIDNKLEKAKSHVFARQHMQVRLHNLFSHLIPSDFISKDITSSSFYTFIEDGNNTLKLRIFFDNGIDPDPAFSGIIQGDIFLEDSQLILKSFPIDKKSSAHRKEVLLSNVSSYIPLFYGEKYHDKFNKKNGELNYFSIWQKNNPNIPYIIQFEVEVFYKKISTSSEKFIFTFFPASEQSSIPYDKKKVV